MPVASSSPSSLALARASKRLLINWVVQLSKGVTVSLGHNEELKAVSGRLQGSS